MTPNSFSASAPLVLQQTKEHLSQDFSSNGINYGDDMEAQQFFFVSSYTDFNRLAHGPRGEEASYPISVYSFQPQDGSLVLLNKTGKLEKTVNPAFSCFHPSLDVIYTCTEDIDNNGQIIAYSLGQNGELSQIGQVDAGGTSTCYLTVDHAHRHLLVVNYWDSTLCVVPISPATGAFLGPIRNKHDCKCGIPVVAAGKNIGGANHSHNDEFTMKARQADPHSHALELDPYRGCVAYVPDLGKDVIREFYYDDNNGKFELEMSTIPSGLNDGRPQGPRYIEFHPNLDVAYVVNELSSTVAVFKVNRTLITEMAQNVGSGQTTAKDYSGKSTLELVQSISTLPTAFPTLLNTCGRICVHPSGRFILVSNRGHDSIAVFRVNRNSGDLSTVGFFHTRGETPRHFGLDSSGQFLLVANQDTDSVKVFTFNLSSGDMKYTGNDYKIPSPNFLCACAPRASSDFEQVSDQSSEKESVDETESPTSTITNRDLQLELQAELEKARNEISILRKQVTELGGR